MPLFESHYQSAYWRAIREQCFERDNWSCRLCFYRNAQGIGLQAHHRTYERFGQEALDDVTTLCIPCHVAITDHQRRARYTQRALPTLQDSVAQSVLVVWTSMPSVSLEDRTVTGSDSVLYVPPKKKETPLEENTVVPPGRRVSLDDALWTTRRPLEPLV